MKSPLFQRRAFLTAGMTAAVTAVAMPQTAKSEEIHGAEPWGPHDADSPHPVQSPDYVYFTPAEIAFVEAVTERLIPADDLGPGAKACRVTFFIDHQLAGAYGRAQRWYMQGPWAHGTPTQGFQSRLDPAAMYRVAIREIDTHVQQTQGGKTFAELGAEAQDNLISDLEHGRLELQGADAQTFFKMLLLNTKEGMFSDPIYGGNKDMAGWKMVGFPGARYDYRDWVGKHNQRYDLPPVGLSGRPAWTQKS